MSKVFTPEERRRAIEASAAGRADRQRRHVEQCAATVDALLADADGPVPAWAQAHAAKARRGNLRSLIALKCADCSCWVRAEIAACPVTSCPLHAVRPYR
jgi:hypothetical protein